MSRRIVMIGLSLALLVLGAAGAYFAVRQLNEKQRMQEGGGSVDAVSGELNRAFSDVMSNIDISGPEGDWLATLDGDATKLTYTVSNRSKNLYKALVFDDFTLDKVAPREKATLPIKVRSLAPGESHSIVLHYDGLQWLGEDVPVNRIDLGWAEKGLDLSESWVAAIDPRSLQGGSGSTAKVSNSKGSSKATGIRVRLVEADARTLKERRDAALKAKTEADKPKEALPSKP